MVHLVKKLVSFYTTHSHTDVSLDLSHITDQVIVCSCPTVGSTKTIYTNSLADLLHYLDTNHSEHWRIWNLRLEDDGGYDVSSLVLADSLSYVPWPDHQSPPFELLQSIVRSIGEYIRRDSGNVAVIHCKLGKGRSGLVTVGVLMVEMGYTLEDADTLFTERRMRSGFGSGMSIKCQRRYARYLQLSKDVPYDPDFRFKFHTIRFVGALFDALDEQIEIGISSLVDGEPSTVHPKRISDQGNHVIATLPSDELALDVKISLLNRFSSRLNITTALAYTCFNMYWESLSQKANDGAFVTKCHWNEMDGFKGTEKKGLKLFESMELYWTPIC